MTQTNQEQLKKAFHQDIIILYKRIHKELKYKPTRLMDYINKYGGYEAAVKYITTENNVQDFAVLWENQRLDLSVEALITKPTYRVLFLVEVLDFCDRKIAEYSYAPNEMADEPEDTGYIREDVPATLEEEEKQIEVAPPIKALYAMYNEAPVMTEEMWTEALKNSQLVTPKNLDLLQRIYLIGDGVTPVELSKEEGYPATYPYNEVVTALAKRLKEIGRAHV